MGSPTLTELQGRGRGVRTGPISFHEPSPLPWRKTPCLPGRAAFPPFELVSLTLHEFPYGVIR